MRIVSKRGALCSVTGEVDIGRVRVESVYSDCLHQSGMIGVPERTIFWAIPNIPE